MNEVLIYHNPRWGKSRESVQILNDLGVDYTILEYLKHPPSKEDLESIARKMGVNAKDFTRTNEEAFKELNLKDYINDDAYMFKKMSENPKLIERPIVVKGEKAVIGRPPSKIKQFLNAWYNVTVCNRSLQW